MRRVRGFTLVEMIVVLTLMGVVATLLAVPLIRPVQGFADTARRVAMADALDNALRRVARETRNLLPNSLRQPGSGCIEMIPTLGGGRYRSSGTGDLLDFAQADTSFDVLSSSGLSSLPAGSQVVIYNLGISGADAYEGVGSGTNVANLQSFSAGKITLTAGKQFPLESPGKRFHVIPPQSVVFACINPGESGEDGSGQLVRYTRTLGGGALSALSACPSTAPAGAAVLVDKVRTCAFYYAAGALQRDGVLMMQLAIQQGGETARLFHETHVNNVP